MGSGLEPGKGASKSNPGLLLKYPGSLWCSVIDTGEPNRWRVPGIRSLLHCISSLGYPTDGPSESPWRAQVRDLNLGGACGKGLVLPQRTELYILSCGPCLGSCCPLGSVLSGHLSVACKGQIPMLPAFSLLETDWCHLIRCVPWVVVCLSHH